MKSPLDELKQLEGGVPKRLRKIMLDCAMSRKISYHWLLGLYQRGRRAGRKEGTRMARYPDEQEIG